ncbi:CBS domain-containing protein [Desulfocapsa sulfexigens DSM 10523]|uniref:CBS domain-containing protein n=1 Tax=Desulfocapsa sulfexigens (strain DSM 10523 / SB164P1) TaxID=1167006 RepID=M1PDI6_DESSD|nr:hemolysin family protein [Desulfocapsa sulfexigens]AGF79657.1 CBS domain-containing protein [Desulfocapsa sulfexigens DSM 10523]
MTSTLIVTVFLAVAVSAFCSILEAVLYSISTSQVEMLKKQGHKSGPILQELREDIDEPITAILTLNTIANTLGAAVAGAAAAVVFGEENLFLFSAVFTLIILLFSEILPKTFGVSYTVLLAPYIALPLRWMVIILKPIIRLCQLMTKVIPQAENNDTISAEELQAIAALSKQSGEIGADQERVIFNILELGNRVVRDVMTPRTVTFSLDETMTVADVMANEARLSSHSRIPVYKNEPDNVSGIIMRRDVLRAVAEQRNDTKLSELTTQVHFVAEMSPLNHILVEFFEIHQHLFVVVDEYGAVTGVISMEDVLEEIVGREIVDESDKTHDMRELARKLNRKIPGKLKKNASH